MRNARVSVRSQGGHRYEFPLAAVTVTIGRSGDCTLVLDDRFVSRLHARIEEADGCYRLADENSSNGTIVSGRKIEGPYVLSDGDEFQIGNTVLTYLESPSEATTALFVPTNGDERPPSLRVDEQKWEVLIDGRRVDERLSALEFKLLAHLGANAGNVCPKRDLGVHLWGEDGYTDEMLYQLVHRLKRRLRPYAQNRRFIETIPGVGYRLSAEEEAVNAV